MTDVSFIVAAYNVEPYVEAAIASALQQSGVAAEVIVVDDASSDGTADKVAALAAKDDRITLVRRDARKGPSAARNTAMEAAKGTWLAILDADDLISPPRTRRLIDLALATSADIVADNFERFSDSGGTLSTMLEHGPEPYAFFVDIATFLEGNAMFDSKARLGYVKPMFRTAFMRAHALKHHEDILIGEDFHLLLSCLLAGGRFVVTSDSFYRYRVREGSISYRLDKRDIDRLLAAHDAMGLEDRFRDDAEITAASRTYAGALERARVIAEIIDDTKTGNLPQALLASVRHPEAWPLLARFGGAAVAKRLRP